jgi:hypothetical protein
MALKNKYFTEKLVLFFLILTMIGLLSGCAFPPADDVPSDPVVNDPVVDDPIIEDPVDEPTQPTVPGEIDDPNGPELKEPPKEPPINNTEPETPIKPIESELKYKRAFFVSNSGDDSKDGLTPETAWRTIARVNKQVLEPGDAVLFKRGNTWVNENLAIRHSGTAENRIIYSAYGEGPRPVFTGIHEVRGWKDASNWDNLGNNAWSIRLGGANDRRLWLNGVEVERSRENVLGVGGVSKDYPWQFWSSYLYVYSVGNPSEYYNKMEITSGIFLNEPTSIDYITINNLDIGGWRYTRLSGCSHWIIEHCNWGWGNTGSALTIRGHENKVSEGGIIRNCTFDSGDRFPMTVNPSEFMYSYTTHSAVILNALVNNWRVHDNEFLAWGHTTVAIRSVKGISEGNKVYNNYFSQEWGSYGRALGARGERLEDFNENNPNEFFNNYIYEQNVPSQFGQPYLRVYNNIFYMNNGTERNRKGVIKPSSVSQALTIGSSSGQIPYNMKFYNNIFAYSMHSEAVGINIYDYQIHPAEKTEIVNNIFYNNNRHFFGINNHQIKDTLFKNNLFFTDKNDFLRVYNKNLNVKDFNALITNDLINNPQNWITSGNLNVDPMFVDPENGDFRLRAGSPAIGAGINVGLTHDYDGKQFKSTPSIGPYEYYP